MEYEILEGQDTHQLTKVVNKWIQNGWQPIGGVSVIWRNNPLTGDIEWNYAQAVVREVKGSELRD